MRITKLEKLAFMGCPWFDLYIIILHSRFDGEINRERIKITEN